MPAAHEDQAVLVAGADGVFQIAGDGTIVQLVVGPVAYAVDDTHGGLLFQVERGRKTFAGYEGEPPPADPTTIWWVPTGAAAPQQLLVPTPGAGHYLTLHDAFAAGESFVVVYERHEGTIPYNGDMADTLRLYDVVSQTVTEIYGTRGHEWYLGEVSSGGSLVAATEVQILGSGCRLLDRSGDLVTRPGFPSADAACFDESTTCATSCALSSDAARVAYDRIVGLDNGVEWEVAVAAMAGGDEIARLTVPVAGRWGPADLDIAGDLLLLNRAWEGIFDSPALSVDVTHPGAEPLELPVAGRARFATSPVAIAAPVRSLGMVNVGADYYRFGDDGLYRVIGGIESQLVAEPVWAAWDDLLGGVMYPTPSGTGCWLRRGFTESLTFGELDPGNEELAWTSLHFTGLDDGRPAVFYSWSRSPEGDAAEDAVFTCDELQLVSRNLLTGAVTGHMCLPIEDAGLAVRSIGNGTFVGAPFSACGGTSTSSAIQFWDLVGNPVDSAINPFPPEQSCAPCELRAMVSPDGRLLAYQHRPDSFHHDSPYYSGPACGGGGEQRDAWWEGSQSVPAEVVVMDLASGQILWRSQPPTGSHLADFDGRYLVVSLEEDSVIYDLEGEHPTAEVASRVTLMRDPQPPEPGLAILRASGLGTAFFGDPAEAVMRMTTSMLGPPAQDELIDPAAEGIALPFGYAANRYFRTAQWPELGLTLVFSDGGYFRIDGRPHFISWGLSRPGLTTAAGVTVSSNVLALQTAYGNTLRLPDRFVDECQEGWEFRIEPHRGSGNEWFRISGQLDGDPDGAGTAVVQLTGGAAPTC